MIDLHTHSIFSDGVLIPSELVRRAEARGYRVIAITDHADRSNLDFIIPRLVTVCESLNEVNRVRAVPGIELTHVPPAHIKELAAKARSMGAAIILVHGETIAEPVAPGTNRAALESPIDVLAHPGLITEEEVRIASERGIFLEITTRKGHSLTNGHVAALAVKHGAHMVLDSDSHEPADLITEDWAKRVVLGAGLGAEEFERMQENARSLLR